MINYDSNGTNIKEGNGFRYFINDKGRCHGVQVGENAELVLYTPQLVVTRNKTNGFLTAQDLETGEVWGKTEQEVNLIGRGVYRWAEFLIDRPRQNKSGNRLAQDNKELRDRSGDIYISNSKLTSFLYELMRDHIPFGDVEKLVRDSQDPNVSYCNGWLGQYAKDLADRLTK